VAPEQKSTAGRKWTVGHLSQLALEGILGNAAWALVLIVAVVIAALLKGQVAAWIFSVALVVVLGLSALISTGLMRQVERMKGARDESRHHAAEAIRRANEIEERSETAQRELRDQLAAATGGQQAVSTRMQSIARQVDALAAVPTGNYGPTENQVELLVALLEDLSRMTSDDDPVVTRLLAAWRDSNQGHSHSAWDSALGVLKARAVSIGTEEALGQQP
jgi:membrane protein implicated in regulation of membrane protease activity